jgi:hypothetical protein
LVIPFRQVQRRQLLGSVLILDPAEPEAGNRHSFRPEKLSPVGQEEFVVKAEIVWILRDNKEEKWKLPVSPTG